MEKRDVKREELIELIQEKIYICQKTLKKKKRKFKLIKGVYYSSIVVVILLTSATGLVNLFAPPTLFAIIGTSLAAGSAITTGIGAKFNIASRKNEQREIIKQITSFQSELQGLKTISTDVDEATVKRIIKFTADG